MTWKFKVNAWIWRHSYCFKDFRYYYLWSHYHYWLPIILWIINNRISQPLQVYSDLVCSSCVRGTFYQASSAIIWYSFHISMRILTYRYRDNFVMFKKYGFFSNNDHILFKSADSRIDLTEKYVNFEINISIVSYVCGNACLQDLRIYVCCQY